MKTTYTFQSEGESHSFTHTFETEDYLPDLLYQFKSFLQGAGYNYITEVYAVKDDGVEVGEE